MIYYIIYIILAIFAFNTEVIRISQLSKGRKILLGLFSIGLILFAGMRWNTGYDYQSYKEIFERSKYLNFMEYFTTPFLGNVEPGFKLLMFAFKDVSYEWFVMVCALISFVPKAVYIYKKYYSSILSMLLYYSMFFCLFDMGIIRQGIALSFAIWALYFYSVDKKKNFIALVLISMLFHVSSVLIFLIVWLGTEKKSNGFYFKWIIFSIIFSQLHFLHLIQRLPIPFVHDKLWYYMYSYGGVSVTSIVLSVLKRIAIFVVFLYFVDWDKMGKDASPQEILHLNSFFLSIIVALLLVEVPILAGRGTAIFQMSQIFLFPALFNSKYLRKIKGNVAITKFVLFFIVIGWSLYSFNALLGSHDYIPYMSVFDKS